MLLTNEDIRDGERRYLPFLVNFFSFFFLFIHSFRLRSWRIKLHMNGTANADLSRLPLPKKNPCPLLFLVNSTRRSSFLASGNYLTVGMNEVEKDGDVRIRKLKAFSCVSDPRCE